MSPHYFDTVTSERYYTKNAKDAKPLSDLPVGSGSSWGTQHLKACHVIVSSNVDICFPLLDDYDLTIRETFKAGEENAHIAAFIKGLASNHQTMRQHALVREVDATLARFWVALRDMKGLKANKEEPQNNQRTSGRVRLQTTHPGYVDSECIASSSQDHESSQESSSTNAKDSFTSVQRPAAYLPVEAYTVELAFSAITHILLYTQDPSLDMSVEIRQPERHYLQVKDKRITAIDDGGLTVISRAGARTKNSVVLIEAKRRLDVCEKTNLPFVSDERLGQMTCEAVAARSSRQGGTSLDDIFVISTAQHYMCLFHFIVTASHLDDLKNGIVPRTAINVTATRWLDLERRNDRKCIVKNVLQLAEYMRQMEG
ncbi:uncharacterized protein FTJAE_3698 [Fusarium tjaetaba]|uniref:Uncharacterized protein n=1 Tax=Fusarium tjaetaba TaxID=1567544 RepID=A0A8H5RYT8_9HYPO|nr:uncharacterized protein FTJAE_3698 [Fusarium tjaetaba]KAF5642223.1 hypothetical protein FTJAE_3698 [Fusarium tjaetaba]